jgi:L-iditol 2-dehydrogenase/L-gulonate 5-dehydrogenase
MTGEQEGPMKAIVLDAPRRLRVVDRDQPTPGAAEALVRVVAAGICASDVATIRGDNPIAAYPLTPGHECIGVVESAPSGSAMRPGDWVTVYPSVGCGACPACRAGRINHCPTFEVLGISRDGGVFAEKLAVGADQLLPVPDRLGGPAGALIEPTAVGVHVNRRGGTRAGDRVLIIGAGVIGTLVAQVARAAGAADVVLVDRFETRRPVLAALGFDKVLLAGEEPLGERVLALGGPVDVVYDTVCGDRTIDTGLDVLAPGGRLVLVAVPHGAATLRVAFAKVYKRELSLIAARNYVPDDFREAMRLIADGAVEVAALITASYPLAEFEAAYAELTGNPQAHLKILLRP